MNKKIFLLISIIAFQALLFVNLFFDFFLTKHNVELTYKEIQETCYDNKNVKCDFSIDLKNINEEQLEKIKNYKFQVDITYNTNILIILKVIILSFNICLFIYFFFYYRKNHIDDDNYNFWLLFLFALGSSCKFIHFYMNNIHIIPFLLFLFILFLSCAVFFIIYFIFYFLGKSKPHSILFAFFVNSILINSINIFSLEDIFDSNYFKVDYFLILGVIIFVFSILQIINIKKILIFGKYFIVSFLMLTILNCFFKEIRKIGLIPDKNAKIISKKYDIKKSNFDKNIYIILLDMYAGDKILKDLNHDNKSFWEFLEKEKFYLKKDFSSNYNFTLLSLPSFLSLDYVENLPYSNTKEALENITLFDILKSQGYQIFYHNPAPDFIIVGKNSIDYLNISDNFSIHNALNFLLKETLYKNFLLEPLLELSFFEKEENEFLNFALNSYGKKLVFLHCLMPHYPYKYDENGNDIKEKFNIKEKNIEILNKESYISYLKYTNKQIKTMIQTIKEQDSNSIIILTSDHGARYKFFYDGEDKHENELKENPMIVDSFFNTFLAYYNPDNDYKNIKKVKSLVNLSRMLIIDLFKANLEFLPDKKFFLYSNTKYKDSFINQEGFYLQ